MKIKVKHTIEYSYSTPVYLENHYIKLKPKNDNTQNILKYEIDIAPEPQKCTFTKDVSDNDICCLWFDELIDKLKLAIEFEVNALRANPFDFILENSAITTPISYTDVEKSALSEYFVNITQDKEVINLTNSLLISSNNDTLSFLNAINMWIYKNCKHIIRPHGDPQQSHITLAHHKGSCRDMAVLFMDMCKLSGIASRFVSGYHYIGSQAKENHLHAWVEVYLPGAGWVSYDPSEGLVVSDRYVVLAASSIPQLTAPVTGSFRGDNVTSTMKAKVKVSKLAD